MSEAMSVYERTVGATSRGQEKTKAVAENAVLRRDIARDFAKEVAEAREKGRPLDSATVDNLIQQTILMDLSDLTKRAADEDDKDGSIGVRVNDKIKAFSALRSSARGSGVTKVAEDADEKKRVEDFEKRLATPK